MLFNVLDYTVVKKSWDMEAFADFLAIAPKMKQGCILWDT